MHQSRQWVAVKYATAASPAKVQTDLENAEFKKNILSKIYVNFIRKQVTTARAFTMGKRKADTLNQASLVNGSKKAKLEERRNILSGSDSESDKSDGGAKLETEFKINADYAKRFEHNKKREERQRC
jgi:hypothetical protein